MTTRHSSPSSMTSSNIYRNNKNQRLYEVLHIATDATNSRDGNEVVVYRAKYGRGRVFCRDKSEFDTKFTKVGA